MVELDALGHEGAAPNCTGRAPDQPGKFWHVRLGWADDQSQPARTSTNPAALKSPSNARASRIRRRRITAKLVASTKEYSRSPRARSQRQASVSVASSTCTTSASGSALNLSRKPTAAECPERLRRRVHVSPTTWFVVTTRPTPRATRARACSCRESRRSCRPNQKLVSANFIDLGRK